MTQDEKLEKLCAFLKDCHEQFCVDGYEGGDLYQELAEKHGLIASCQAEPGSSEADEWGEDAQLYYVKDEFKTKAGA